MIVLIMVYFYENEGVETVEKELLKNGTPVFCNAVHRIQADGPLLASFVKAGSNDRLLDLGTGNGIIPLWLYDRGFRGRTTGVEIQADAAEMFRKSIEESGIEHFEVSECDMRQFRSTAKYDIVTANPPYFDVDAGELAKDSGRAAARSEIRISLSELIVVAKKNLKEGGRFYCCYPPNRMANLFRCLSTDFSPKRLRFCRNDKKSEPWLLFLEAIYHGGEGLSVLPDLIVLSDDGFKTEEFRDIFIGKRDDDGD